MGDLNEALAKGATAAAEAEQAETAAQGNAKALLIAEKAKAEAARIAAQADADADRIRAEGQMDAARKLEQSNVAVELARIAKTGEALHDKTSIIFGASAANVPALLSNSAVVGADGVQPAGKKGIFG